MGDNDMKKSIVFLCIFALLVLTGCSNSTTKETETEAKINAFPYGDLKYGDDTFELSSVNVFCGRDDSGHGYNAYVALRFDISNMSDDGKYWMLKDQYDYMEFVKIFSPSVRIECEDNGMDLEKMYLYDKEIADDYVYFLYDMDECRKEFTNENTSFMVSLTVYQTDDFSETFDMKWYVNREYADIVVPVLDFADFEKVKGMILEGKGNELNN